ncbi:MAG: prenyltransferase [Anaerolineales bacterium]|nr:prenyltransferase [Anaerolineales bacterium]
MSIGSRDVRASTAADVVLRLRVWTRSFRLKFLPQGVLPVLLGSIVAWRETGQFDLAFFTLAIIGAACVQIGLTMLNDALDYVYGTDRSETAKENPYSGGSGVLADHLLRPGEILAVATLFYLVAAMIGAYLTFRVGIGVFWMALLGLFLSVSYSVKPLRLSHRGLGELAMLMGYGPTITLGAAYVQTGQFSVQAGLAGLLPGLLMWSMILVNEIPDYHDDVRAEKRNLIVRLGLLRGRWLYIASLSGVYAFVFGGVVSGAFPAWGLLAFGSALIAFRSFRVVYRRYRDPCAMVPANKGMVLVYSSTMMLFSLGLWLSNMV